MGTGAFYSREMVGKLHVMMLMSLKGQGPLLGRNHV